MPADTAAPAHAKLLAAWLAAQQNGVDLDPVIQKHQPALLRALASTSESPALRLEALQLSREALVEIRAAAIQLSQVLLAPEPVLAARADLAAAQLPGLHRELAILRSMATRMAGLLEKEPRPGAELHAVVVRVAGRADAAKRLLAQSESALALLQSQQRWEGAGARPAVRAALVRVRAGLQAASSAGRAAISQARPGRCRG